MFYNLGPCHNTNDKGNLSNRFAANFNQICLINKKKLHAFEVQFQRLTQVLLTLCKPMDFPTQGLIIRLESSIINFKG